MKKYLKYIHVLLLFITLSIFPLKIEASTITLDKNTITIGVGYSENLKYTLASGLNSSNIIWNSSNKSIVKIENGKVTGLSPGAAIITATIAGQSSTCKVTVISNYIPTTGISLNKNSLTLTIGGSETLTKTIKPNNATNQSVTWISSNRAVATVENGKIVAKKAGTAIITASSSGYNATCKVIVVDNIKLNKITLDKTTLTIKEKEQATLKVTYTPSTATNKKVTWTSSDSKIVKVDSNGKVTAVSPGNATITAKSADGGYTSVCKVTVSAISKKVTSVSLDKKELSLITGESASLKVNINPSYAENKNVTWESDNENIATVENGKVTAIGPGSAKIKVISEDGKKEDVCKVTVTSPPIKGISFSEIEKTVYINTETVLNTISDPVNSVLESPIWTSSNEVVATVTNGIVYAHSIGQTTITISNKEKTITASINIIVVNKPKEKLNITIEGYKLNFDPKVKDYSLEIGNENELTIKTNIEKDKVIINGNKNLKNGSIITITITEDEKTTYIINIKKKGNYTIIFIAIISILLLLNLVRIIIKNKKKSN